MIYERSPQPSEQPAETTPYEDYPPEWATKIYYVRRSDGSVENGWVGLGSYVENGTAMIRVGKSSQNEQGEDILLTKDLPVAALDQFNAEERERRRAERQTNELGHRAAELTVSGVKPNYEEDLKMTEEPYGKNMSRRELWEKVGFDPESSEQPDPLADKQEASPENPERARLERLFAFPEARGRDKWGNDLDVRMKVTPESAKDASTAFRYLEDDTVRDLIKRYAGEKWREDDMAEVLRENNELRVELGAYLLTKLDTLQHLPSRFYGQQLKNPNEGGYEGNMTSQEYAALLAVSMLDGTFKTERTRHDPIEMQYGEVIRGQHRYAALRLLNLERSPLADIKQV
jgi:hypothetical protein